MWGPLEKLFKDDDKCAEFMFMGTRDDIHLYKHINTRRYINIDDKGKFYIYTPTINDYLPIDKNAAINHVFN